MQLEQMFGYRPRVEQEERQQTYFVVGDLEALSASALYTPKPDSDFGGLPMFSAGNMKIDFTSGIKIDNVRPTKNTEYFKILETPEQTIGVSHHSIGLGKLKIFDQNDDEEYGVPLIDILNKPLKDWRIDKK